MTISNDTIKFEYRIELANILNDLDTLIEQNPKVSKETKELRQLLDAMEFNW